MYSVRVEPGMERILVPQGVIPMYRSAAVSTMWELMRIVPGYVFVKTKTEWAEKVPDNDWRIIEAIGSREPSTLDIRTRQIVDGPLKGLLIYRIDPTVKAVLIRANLLGETREYWLPVRFSDGVPEKREEKAEKVEKEEKEEKEAGAKQGERVEEAAGSSSGEEKKGRKKNALSAYTDEQKAEMLEKAAEIGVKAAAKAFGIAWQTIAQMRRWCSGTGAGESAEMEAVRGNPPAEEAVREEPLKKEAATEIPPEKEPETQETDRKQTAILLAEENARLKGRLACLEEQVAGLQKAIRELL